MDEIKLNKQTADRCKHELYHPEGTNYYQCSKCGVLLFSGSKEGLDFLNSFVSEDEKVTQISYITPFNDADPNEWAMVRLEKIQRFETDNEIALRMWDKFYKETLKPGVWYGAYVSFPKWLTQQKED